MEYLVLSVLALLLGGVGAFAFLKGRTRNTIESSNATILLEKVKPVCKMVTIEGSFSEILEHTEHTTQLWGLINQKKKSLTVVQGKALVGFDLQKVHWEPDERSQTLRIRSFPPPEIVGIDHTVRYYDKQSSILTSHKLEDDNRILALAKDLLRDKVAESSLPEEARKQVGHSLAVIALMCEQMGWKLEYDQKQLSSSGMKLLRGD